MIELINSTANSIYSNLVAWQRHLHQNPELSFCEVQTAAFIHKTLREMGLHTLDSFAPNSVVALIEAGASVGSRNATLALRADIDALPITENPGHEVCSQNDGIMHACGHDIHTASLLGTAAILMKHRHLLTGNVLLIFQPAEEKLPGGAGLLIKNGLLSTYKPFAVLGQHVEPGLPVGSFGFCPGAYMASTDEIYIQFSGRGGHAATPDVTNNTVLALAQFVTTVQDEFSKLARNSDMPALLRFGLLEAKGATNIIPGTVRAEGTLRCFDEKLRQSAKDMLVHMSTTIASLHSCEPSLNIVDGYPALINHTETTHLLMRFASEIGGGNSVVLLPYRLTAEDFAYYAQEVPAVFYRMGIAADNKGVTNLHNPDFDHHDSALLHSAATMAYLAIRLLENQ